MPIEILTRRSSPLHSELSGSFRATQLGVRGALLISADSFTGLLDVKLLRPIKHRKRSVRADLSKAREEWTLTRILEVKRGMLVAASNWWG